MEIDITSNKYLTIAFILIFLLSMSLSMFKMYLLRKMHDAKKNHTLATEHHTHSQEQYISMLEKNDDRLKNISTVMLFVVSVPAMIFAFIMTVAITSNVFLGIIFSLITYAAMLFTLRTRVLVSR